MALPSRSEATIEPTDPGERTLTGRLERTSWVQNPAPSLDDDPTVLDAVTPVPDAPGSDLHVPTRRSFPVIRSDLDELPPDRLVEEATVKLGGDGEATLLRTPTEQTPAQGRSAPRSRRRARRIRSGPEPEPLSSVATKSGLAGLLVGLFILVPITIAVICGSF